MPEELDQSQRQEHRAGTFNSETKESDEVEQLKGALEELTLVPIPNQKLLYKGKVVSGNGSLAETGLKDGAKLQLLGSTSAEVGGLRAVEDEAKRREQVPFNLKLPIMSPD